MSPKPTTRSKGWALFDRIIAAATAEAGYTNPWEPDGSTTPPYTPDYDTLRRLLGVPLVLKAKPVSGVPALALDVWLAYELRRAGFEPDRVWPRSRVPRIVPRMILQLLEKANKEEKAGLLKILNSGKTYGGAFSAEANILGKNYVKQVDVVMSDWDTGPELMISSKRMDSSFGKNAANRVEESYGDAKNLRSRHPQAALGFLYALNAKALTEEPTKARWLIDLLGKLGREDDAYDAVGLLIPQTFGVAEEIAEDEDEVDDALAAAGLDEATDEDEPELPYEAPPPDEVDAQLAELPKVDLIFERVPVELRIERFLPVMVSRVLDNCPINYHEEARKRRAATKDLL